MDCARLPRFTRASPVAPVELTGRDRNIIRLVHQHRFLRSSHIVQLLGGSGQQILRRLQLLYHHGWLERPRAQIDYFHRGGSRAIVYGLGNKGAALLKREYHIPFHQLDWGPKNRAATRLFLEHALLISDVMVALEFSCRKDGRVRLIHADALAASDSRTGDPYRWSVAVSNGLKLGLIPDQVFALESSTGELFYFFLESDTGSMPVKRRGLTQSSFYRKLLAYGATWRQNIHRRRFGFQRFRVLTVTNSPARVKSLVDVCSKMERGHGLFLFTDVQSLLGHPEPLSLDWQSGRAGETGRLLDRSSLKSRSEQGRPATAPVARHVDAAA